jgi:hypothetical protein
MLMLMVCVDVVDNVVDYMLTSLADLLTPVKNRTAGGRKIKPSTVLLEYDEISPSTLRKLSPV